MDARRDSVAMWSQTGKQWCMAFFYLSHDFAVRNRGHWAAGIMFGLAGAASIFSRSPDIPWIFSYGAVLGFIASTAKYISQNLTEIIRYGIPTTFAVLAITLFLFHGLTSLSGVITWLPVLVSTTLLATTNVAPGVTGIFIALSEGLFALRELRGAIGVPRSQTIDLERAQDHLPGMVELQTIGYRSHRSYGSVLSYILRLPESRILQTPEEGSGESIELDNDTLSTTSEIRQELRTLDPGPGSIPQYIAIANVGLLDGQRVYFPDIPQDNPLEMDPRIEEPAVEELIQMDAITDELSSGVLLPA